VFYSYRFEFCVTTVSKLFTPTVPSGAEGRLNQLTPGIVGTSVATRKVVYLRWLMSTQPFILSWWINRVLAITTAGVRVGDAASAGWQITLCDPMWHAGSRSGVMLLAQTAILLYLLPLNNMGCYLMKHHIICD